ncbi:MAG TPA: ATP synthase F1 subunit gamma [Candidatus Limnocylindrales bacterium]|nr:ATP synthase F1 subunit gamma [Candidatus Limnocylindrales bacterium]
MPTAREVKKRIRSIKNIGQITRALEAVSASRVRKAQQRVVASRAYAEKSWEILLNVQGSSAKGVPLYPLMTPRTEVRRAMIILVTSDRGLAGAFNTNMLRAARRFGERLGVPVEYISLGRKGRDSLVRAREKLDAEYSNPAEPSVRTIAPIALQATDAFLSGTVDEVFIAYTDFKNTLTQQPRVLRLLPLMPYHSSDHLLADLIKEAPQVSAGNLVYEYEPTAEGILAEIVPRFVQLQLYQAVLESQASEHSARMVAMRNASDNAAGLAEDLTLVYNKARQSGITSEILDIVGGAEALRASMDAWEAQALQAFQAAQLAEDGHKAAEAQAKAQPQAPAPSAQEDDFTVLEGVGPKISRVLKAAGYTTFVQLAEATETELRVALERGGVRLAPSAATWPRQAELAARGAWDELKQLQDTLVSGRDS